MWTLKTDLTPDLPLEGRDSTWCEGVTTKPGQQATGVQGTPGSMKAQCLGRFGEALEKWLEIHWALTEEKFSNLAIWRNNILGREKSVCKGQSSVGQSGWGAPCLRSEGTSIWLDPTQMGAEELQLPRADRAAQPEGTWTVTLLHTWEGRDLKPLRGGVHAVWHCG